jgi:hypothetical protein
LRDWLASPQERARHEQFQRLKLHFPSATDEDQLEQSSAQPEQSSSQLEQSPPSSEPPPEPKKSGRKKLLTVDETELLQAAYIDAMRVDSKRRKQVPKQSDVFDELRKLLGRPISSATLRREIVRPLNRK